MRIITILGTRPEIIRTSRITPLLDKLSEHFIVYTNQNFAPNLRDIFFEDLKLRQPDVYLEPSQSFGLSEQLANMFPQIEKLFKDTRPDKVFILGDTNSALCAIIAERMGIPVYHMEAANRSYNREIPEELNRSLLDHICSYNLYYTPTNKHTLLQEGLPINKIFQCGNPTLEVLNYYKEQIEQSDILDRLGLTHEYYFLADIHRSENIHNVKRLESIFNGLNMVAGGYQRKIICSIHPSTKDRLKDCNITLDENITLLDAFGFFDFVKLEQNAKVGLSDSGLCSEEYCLMHVPCVIVRNETERPEVVEAGGAIIAGTEDRGIVEGVIAMDNLINRKWDIPAGYEYLNVSDRVVNYILGK